MDKDKDELEAQLINTLGGIEDILELMQKEANTLEIPICKLRTASGDWPLVAPLAAKASLLNSIIILRSK